MFANTADVCESDPHECEVLIEETRNSWIWGPTGNAWDQFETNVKVQIGPFTPGVAPVLPARIMIGDLAKPANPICNKRIVLIDTPSRTQYVKDKVWLFGQVNPQVIKIYGINDRRKVFEFSSTFTFGADNAGKGRWGFRKLNATTGVP